MQTLEDYLRIYLARRPMFLSLLRAKELSLYAGYLPLKSPVLDVGSGDGYFASVLLSKQKTENRKQQEKIDVGLDLAGSRMEESRKLGIYKKLETYDGIRMPFGAGSFATVISNCVLEHVDDLPAVLAETVRVMKRGGVFLTTVMAKPWEEHLLGTVFAGSRYKDYMRKTQVHKNLLTAKEWRQRFRDAGFDIIRETGYLSPAACRLIDLGHYLSVPSLITYKLMGNWMPWPALSRLYPQGYFASVLNQPVDAADAGAIFYALKKSG